MDGLSEAAGSPGAQILTRLNISWCDSTSPGVLLVTSRAAYPVHAWTSGPHKVEKPAMSDSGKSLASNATPERAIHCPRVRATRIPKLSAFLHCDCPKRLAMRRIQAVLPQEPPRRTRREQSPLLVHVLPSEGTPW